MDSGNAARHALAGDSQAPRFKTWSTRLEKNLEIGAPHPHGDVVHINRGELDEPGGQER